MAENVGALFALISISIALGCFYGLWVQYCIDEARQNLFAVRDNLFDLARIGKFNYSSDEYKRARASIEMVIRYAHNITIWKVLIVELKFRRLGRYEKKTPMRSFVDHTCDPDLRRVLEEIERSVQKAIARLMLKRSLLLILFVWSIKVIQVAQSIWRPWMINAANHIVLLAESGEERQWRKAQRSRHAI